MRYILSGIVFLLYQNFEKMGHTYTFHEISFTIKTVSFYEMRRFEPE